MQPEIDQKYEQIDKEVKQILEQFKATGYVATEIEKYKVAAWSIGKAHERTLCLIKSTEVVNQRFKSKKLKDRFCRALLIGVYPNPDNKKIVQEARREMIEKYEQGLASIQADIDAKKQQEQAEADAEKRQEQLVKEKEIKGAAFEKALKVFQDSLPEPVTLLPTVRIKKKGSIFKP